MERERKDTHHSAFLETSICKSERWTRQQVPSDANASKRKIKNKMLYLPWSRWMDEERNGWKVKEEEQGFPRRRAQEKSFALGGFAQTPLALMQLVAPHSLHFHTDQAPPSRQSLYPTHHMWHFHSVISLCNDMLWCMDSFQGMQVWFLSPWLLFDYSHYDAWDVIISLHHAHARKLASATSSIALPYMIIM